MKLPLPYLLTLLLFSLIPAGIGLVLHERLEGALKPSQAEVIGLTCLFAVITLLIHGYLLHANTKNPTQFVRSFMAVIALKMFFFMALLFAYGVMNKSHFGGFAVAFLVMYASFLGFESWALIRALRK